MKPTTQESLDTFWADITNHYSENTREALQPFYRDLCEKVDAGEKEYGDASFSLTYGELLAEMAKETLDIPGWGLILRHRIAPGSLRDKHLVDIARWACFLWLMIQELRKSMDSERQSHAGS